ncbi:MAG: NAD(P)H-dependent oxidoreductase [Nanoarchaeota archaeon]
MDFKEIVKKRFAVRSFDGKKVPEAKINELLEIIRFAPSSFNIQPWKIVVIENKELKEKLSPVSWNQPQITTCSHLLVFCADKNILANIERLEKLMVQGGATKEGIKEYIGMMKGFEKGLSEEQKLTWAQRQTYIALGNAVNGATSLGFDSCPMEGFDSKEYSKILGLPSHIIPSAICPVGYAVDKLKPKLRFSEKDVFVRKK